MHDAPRAIVAGEDAAGAAHVRSELIDFIEAAIDDLTHGYRVDRTDEIVGGSLWYLGLEADAADPKAVALEAGYKMTADEPACGIRNTQSCFLSGSSFLQSGRVLNEWRTLAGDKVTPNRSRSRLRSRAG